MCRALSLQIAVLGVVLYLAHGHSVLSGDDHSYCSASGKIVCLL